MSHIYENEIRALKHRAALVVNQGGVLAKAERQALEEIIKEKTVYICGSRAEYARDFITYARNQNLHANIIDDFREEREIAGFKVITSAEFEEQEKEPGSPMVLCSFSAKGQKHFYDLAKKAGLSVFDYIVYAQVLENFPQNHILKNISIDTASHIEELCANISLFEDDSSKETFLSILNARLHMDPALLKLESVCRTHVYTHQDIIKWEESEYIIDGGAYDGDSVSEFLEYGGERVRRIYSFEPDEGNFEKLQNRYGSDQRVSLYAQGLWNKKETLSFVASGNKLSGLSGKSESDCAVPVDSLDNLFAGEPITFIKLDIEGAEKEALEGARQIIKKNHPKIALACYHRFKDLIDIPLQLKSYNPGYKFYLRHFGEYFVETLLYALND